MVDLPLPGGPTMPTVSPDLRLERDAGQRRALARALVAEADIVEAQHALGDDQVLGVRRILDVDVDVEQGEQPGAAGRGAGERIDHQAELAHRHLQDGHEGEELRQRADADLARYHLLAAEPQHQAHGGEERKVHGAGVADADVDALLGEIERVLLGAVEFLHLMALRRKGADDADAAEVLVHHPAQHRQPLLQRQPGASAAPAGRPRIARRRTARSSG